MILTYIRHYFDNRKRETAETAEVFSPLPEGSPYQDVLRLACMDKDLSLLYTVGKSVFPQRYEQFTAPQRWTIFYIAGGTLFFGREPLEAGDFIVVPSAFSHQLSTKKESCCYYWLATNDEWLLRSFSMAGYGEAEVAKGHIDDTQPVTDILEGTLYHFPGQCDRRLYLISRFTQLLSHLSAYATATGRVSEQLLLRCISHIETTYGALTVEDLAKHFFINRRYLYGIFMEYKKISPMKYIQSVRMKAADKFLLTTDYSIAKIAELTGYSNYNQFTRAYKEYYAIQPSKKRETMKSRHLSDQAKG